MHTSSLEYAYPGAAASHPGIAARRRGTLDSMGTDQMKVGGITVELTRADKVLYPDDGITKGDLAEYYRSVARMILPHLSSRPVTMERFPDGIADGRLIQKDAPGYFPDWITTTEVPRLRGGSVHHVVCDRAATLIYLANQACITPHVFLSRADRLDDPDQMVFDLDPPDGDFPAARRGALELRDLLERELRLAAYAKTSGGTGMHVHVPLSRRAGFDEVREFARGVADILAGRHPDRVTTEQRKDKRGARLYVDVMRNAYAQTVVAPYAVRARPGAPVATPVGWDEVEDEGLVPRDFTVRTIADRLRHVEDPWRGMRRRARSIGPLRRRLDVRT